MSMTKEQFQKELSQHDWTFRYSDDSRVFRKGRDNEDRLTRIANESGWQDLFTAARG